MITGSWQATLVETNRVDASSARQADAWSWFTGKEPDMTPEAAMLTCHFLRVNSSKAKRELDYREPALDTMLADMLS